MATTNYSARLARAPLARDGGPRRGATYSTEAHNFGEITNTFDVPVDWQGFRYHGYCWAPTKIVHQS